jgi:hypothetical protein
MKQSKTCVNLVISAFHQDFIECARPGSLGYDEDELNEILRIISLFCDIYWICLEYALLSIEEFNCGSMNTKKTNNLIKLNKQYSRLKAFD